MVHLSYVVEWVLGLETGSQVDYNSFTHGWGKMEKDLPLRLGAGMFER